jgi:hypothetical protein
MNSSVLSSPCINRAAACVITCTVLLIMIALYHHPVVGQYAGAHEKYVHIVQSGASDQLVHGALISMLVVLASALTVFNGTLNAPKRALSVALSAYCLGCTLLGVAMLFDGFVVPYLAGQFIAAQPLETIAGELIMRSIGITIQVFSKAGLIAQCFAIMTWTFLAATSQQGLRELRWLIGIGIVAAPLPMILILFTGLQLTPHSLMAIFTVHAAWYLGVAWWLYGHK